MNDKPAFLTIQPKVLYFGTPIALITSTDQDGKPNIGPISSVWALGYNLILGLGCDGKTYQNILENKECVVNLPSPDLYKNIEKIAGLTGMNPVPENKKDKYLYEEDKFSAGNFQSMPAEIVTPPAIANCPLQLECVLQNHYIVESAGDSTPLIASLHLRVVNVRVHENLVINQNYIDPAAWSPLIYNFRHYYALGKKMGKNFRAEV
ncbi:flavin reductase (DIM6/NTAB) family NADH-FMN oxidoreductase RutF [Pedobacter cryoconitis]|uniref:flavin reductase family protein n=1 Tax=Pedobacter cryoconitis TaxID=188932 RepID=UPI001615C755|nr:flavin reductase family protein [Pedobacter cryoconitis]MBB6270769.1 flavin reductase (DIM6/NTAB) family NADH-FMN oxidoreductase RutF [Pedobacter cryoconitis]